METSEGPGGFGGPAGLPEEAEEGTGGSGWIIAMLILPGSLGCCSLDPERCVHGRGELSLFHALHASGASFHRHCVSSSQRLGTILPRLGALGRFGFAFGGV